MPCIIVAFPKREDAAKMKGILVRSGYDVAGVCTSGSQVIQLANQFDGGIVVSAFSLADMQIDQMKDLLPAGYQILLLASAARLGNVFFSDVVSLEMPLKINDLLSTMDMMCYQYRRRQKKKKQMPKMRSEQDMQLIKDAKELLMARNNLSEEEAHRYIQKVSMDSGNNMVETAGMIMSMFR